MAKATKEEKLARADRMEAYAKGIEETIEVLMNKRVPLIHEAKRLAEVITYHSTRLEFLKHRIEVLRSA